MEQPDHSALDPALEAALPPGIKLDENDPRASLRHVLTDANRQIEDPNAQMPMDWTAHLQQAAAQTELQTEGELDDQSQPTAMTSTYRRNANGSVSSVFSGNRIRYLKKEDGQPLWRKDIQYLFLRMVFEDENRVFTRFSDGSPGHTFADVYIDAMAKSSKTSQILKEKLLSDRESALQMAMICLLVNVGRMNTTLNFFPEMRARVRTYHAIPCLQAQSGTGAYKQLQDGPRLKSILKGAMEDTPQPSNLDELLSTPKPRTNPVNLIFVLSQYAPRVSETHFFPPRDFFDLFMRPTLSSRSRATAFLWLIWWYLESNFQPEESQMNPFGAGLDAGDLNPVKVPNLELISEEEADAENTDTPEELAYGEAKRRERENIVANDMPPAAAGPKKGQKTPMMEHQHNYRFRYSPYNSGSSSAGSHGRPSPSPSRETRPEASNSSHRKRHPHYDGDRTRSPSPRRPTASHPANVKIRTLLNSEENSPSASPSNYRRSSPAPGSVSKPATASASALRGVSNSGKQAGAGSQRSRQKKPQPQSSAEGTQDMPNHSAASNYEHIRQSSYPHHPDVLPGAPTVLTSTPYSDTQYPYQRPFSPEPPMSSTAGPASGGAQRSRARPPPQSIEQSRHHRVQSTLQHRLRTQRTLARRSRRKRGPLIDAWLKTADLPPSFDSDSDAGARWGGLDDAPAVPSTDGDAGDAAKAVSDGLRHLGKALDGVTLERVRKRIVGEVEPLREVVVVREPVISGNVGRGTPVGEEVKKRVAKPRGRAGKGEGKGEGEGTVRKRRKAPKKEGVGAGGGIPMTEFLRGVGDEPRSEASGMVDEGE